MKIRSYACGVKETDWQRSVLAASPGKAKYEYWRSVRDAWPDLPFTSVTCHVESAPNTPESFLYTADRRGVPFARLGMAVHAFGDPAVIVGSNSSSHFELLFTDGKRKGCRLPVHPIDISWTQERAL